MKKASLKLSVGVLSLVAAGAISGQACARVLDSESALPINGTRIFSDPEDATDPGTPFTPPAISDAPTETRSDLQPSRTFSLDAIARMVAETEQAAGKSKPPAAASTGPTPESIPTLRTAAASSAAREANAEALATTAPASPVLPAQPALPVIADLQSERDRLNNRAAAVKPPEKTPPAEDDGLGEDGAFITADEVTSPEENVIIARGSVEMRWDGRLIRADEVHYNQLTGRTVATGNVQTINPDGSIQYADRLDVDNEHAAGTGERIAFIDTENAKLFANRVERQDENTSRLTEAIFTPCELCVKNNVTQEPTWHIQASSITQDKKRRVVIYRNAVFKAKGIPVFYMPILWHADPSAKRASGFLMPKPGYSQRRGATLELPYLWAVSPYTDVIISPEFSSKLNPLLNLEVNRRFYSGDLHTRFGVTSERFFDNKGTKWGESNTRGYMLLDGAFDINEDWRWNFTAQRVWDKTDEGAPIANFYERYKIDEGFPRAGEFSSGSRQLISQANLIRQTDTAFFNLSLISFQSLAIGGNCALPVVIKSDGTCETRTNRPSSPYFYTAARDRTLPAVAPMLDAYWSPDHEILGGRLSLSANAVSVIRKTTPSTDIYPGSSDLYQAGSYDYRGAVDTARANLGLSWRREMITPIGLKIAPFVEARHDEYYLRDYYNAETSYVSADGKDTRRVSRDLSTVGIDLSYPLMRRYQGVTAVIEPVAQIAISPESKLYPELTNEDSNAFEFDETTLFKANRSPGFDLYEGGKRLSLGVKTQLKFDSGLRVSTLLGRAFRQDPEESFYRTYTTGGVSYKYDPSGLAATKSDWIVQADFDSGKGIRGYTRQRLDDDGSIRRGETGLSYVNESTQLTLRHQYDKTGLLRDSSGNLVVVDGELVTTNSYHDLQIFGQHFFNKRWGASARLTRDMKRDAWLRSEASLIYKDDCARFEVVYQRDETALLSNNGKASESISLRISLATLAPSDDDFVNVR